MKEIFSLMQTQSQIKKRIAACRKTAAKYQKMLRLLDQAEQAERDLDELQLKLIEKMSPQSSRMRKTG